MFFSFILSSVSKIISEKNLNKISPNKICFVKMDFNLKTLLRATIHSCLVFNVFNLHNKIRRDTHQKPFCTKSAFMLGCVHALSRSFITLRALKSIKREETFTVQMFFLENVVWFSIFPRQCSCNHGCFLASRFISSSRLDIF